MKRLLIVIPVLILAIIAGFFFYPKLARYLKARPVTNADVLREEIIASIHNPFSQADTVILDTKWGFCGNSDPDQLPVVFDTRLEDKNHLSLLASQIQKPVVTMTEFNKLMDTVRMKRFHGNYPPSLWDTCRVGKLSADIRAEQLSQKHVRLYEYYLFANTQKFLQKDFVFDGNMWTFSITDSSVQVVP